MKGRIRIVAILAFALLFGAVFAIPINTSAAVTYYKQLTAEPSSVQWDDAVAIKYNVTVHGGWVWWNGTIYCNLTTPEGSSVVLSSQAITLNETLTSDWANWSYDPSIAGVWTVSVDLVKTSGNGTLTDPSDVSFTLERQGVWMNRIVQDWTSVVWLMVVILFLFSMLLMVFGRVGREGDKH